MERRDIIRAGEWIQVRSKEEVLATLDKDGRLEGLPFMPEMFAYCGKKLQVFKRAHKTCDPPNGMGGRRMRGAVHLQEVRCDGSGHGGCDAGCLIFWKDAWLKPVDGSSTINVEPGPEGLVRPNGCSEHDVLAGATVPGKEPGPDGPRYICQSTHLASATEPLPWWDFRQYLEDYRSGNVSFGQIVSAGAFYLYDKIASTGLGFSATMKWAYDQLQRLRGGSAYPWRTGEVPRGVRTPSATLDLRPGELVRVRSFPEILATLDQNNKNRGMYFDGELVPFCGRTFRVLKRVQKIIDEKTGRMLNLKTDAIILENVACQARYSKCRHFCPRSIYSYWREIWLERIHEDRVAEPGSSIVAETGRVASPFKEQDLQPQ